MSMILMLRSMVMGVAGGRGDAFISHAQGSLWSGGYTKSLEIVYSKRLKVRREIPQLWRLAGNSMHYPG